VNETPEIALLSPRELPITLGAALDGPSKTIVSDLINAHGFVVFRGYGIQSDQDFHRFVEGLGLENFKYADSFSNAVRHNRTDRVFTANEAPPNVEIFLHHEMAQTLTFPGALFFFCEKAAESGGATPICRSDRTLKTLETQNPTFIAKLRSVGVKYRNSMPSEANHESGQGRSWKDTLTVNSAHEAEEKLAALGYQFNWLEDGGLSVQTPALAAVDHFGRGKDVFFNQIVAAAAGWTVAADDKEPRLCFGDDSPIEHADLADTIKAAYQHTVDLEWQTGDVALLDNLKVMHGRRPFEGSRSVLASLCNPISRPAVEAS
jgi:alpha-ketoglutarate-dependent taurine dioxygenase